MKFLRHLILISALLLIGECAGFTYQADAAYPASTDPMRIKQTYLDQIHLNEAWAAAPEANVPLVVAVVDTGVDLKHPDLKDRLVEGINLIKPGKAPDDDNGHGTNVAGIIAAVMNNDKGITGIAPNARIMPVKALESDGTGGEARLGDGIRYAVDHGAKIVVLSLGLNKYSDNLSESVRYAEEHNVLLVAAVGNEGTSVKYPAAYSSVLAVGGVTPNKEADYRSNHGPELDLVAPWDVFTTARGGGYMNQDGSSMAAPQAAGVAALVWSKYPDFTPAQVRSLLLQTAEDLNVNGWDAVTGYGLLRADLALTQPLNVDRFEPNNRKEEAERLSVQSLIHANLSSGQDQDWFAMESPYDGTVELKVQSADNSEILLSVGQGSNGAVAGYTVGGGQTVSFQVKKGLNYLQLQGKDRSRNTALGYSLESGFHVYRDPFEGNDKQYQAYVLPERSQSITGTFHQKDDQDWYMLPLQSSGTLRLKVSVDTARIDSVILIQKKGEKSVTIDKAGDGAIEISPRLEVLPGDYYIRIGNVKDYSEAITGEYTLSIEYTPKLIDPNEPNDKSYQATFLGLFSEYSGLFQKDSDQDWFEFRLTEQNLSQLSIAQIPVDRTVSMTLLDSNLKEKAFVQNQPGESSLNLEQPLPAGTYYMKLQSDQWFLNQMYKLKIGAYPMTSGYIDINGHWAADAIGELSDKQIVGGYGNYRFGPDRSITRAEAAAILVRALNLSKQKPLKYSDLLHDHWAYSYISKAEQSGVIDGYPDKTFAPDRPLTRMEMTAMLAKSMNMAGKLRGNSPFEDVSNDYWGVGILKQMRADGWIDGFTDGTFKPEQTATRAEFVSLLNRVLNR